MPFFCYYGGKARAASFYPKPLHKTIIEPFAGAAGYALRWHYRNVILVEKEPRVAAVWKYLIAATPKMIRDLPLAKDIPLEGLSKLKTLAPAERWLIGFWFFKGSSAGPLDKPTPRVLQGNASYWGAQVRLRLAQQVERIKHWMVVEGDYRTAPEMDATWFIDPPYQNMGRYYTHGCDEISFPRLASWCQSREGQVIVCENEGADWLPFKPFHTLAATNHGGRNASKEVIWLSKGQKYPTVRKDYGFFPTGGET
jgi:site-specific DNA-adenine methylase